MHMKRIAVTLLLTLQIALTSPSIAQTSIDEKDAAFQTCVQLLTPRAGEDYAVGYCYQRYYGNERTGGGSPEYQEFPSPGGCAPQGSVPVNCVPV